MLQPDFKSLFNWIVSWSAGLHEVKKWVNKPARVVKKRACACAGQLTIVRMVGLFVCWKEAAKQSGNEPRGQSVLFQVTLRFTC